MARGIGIGTIGVFAMISCWAAGTAAQQPPTRVAAAAPPGTLALAEPAVLWRLEIPRPGPRSPGRHYSAFAPDGSMVGLVHPSRIVWLLDAADGRVLERIDPASTARRSYSMAIANTGRVAVGRPGSMQIHEVSAGGPIALFPCAAPACTPTSLAFSPDGSLLALQEVHPFVERRERDLGSVRVVDLEIEGPTRMKATTGLDRLSFFSGPRSPPAGSGAAETFRIWHTAEWELPRSMLGNGWTVGSVPADSTTQPTRLVAVYRSGSSVAMRDFDTDRLLWAAPLIRPRPASNARAAARSELDHVEIAPNGRFLIGYEAPAANDAAGGRPGGAIVVRSTLNGAVVEAYAVPGVSDLAIAPDSGTFVYTVDGERAHAALVRVPTL